MTVDFNRFIEENLKADTKVLRLKYHGNDEILKAIQQIELRQKSPEKFIDSQGRNRQPDTFYSSVAVEQTTAASIADFHASLIPVGSKVLDMTMGMGSDALAFSMIDGCHVTAIEANSELAAISQNNYAEVGNLTIICADSVEWLRQSVQKFDVIFIDPARRDDAGNRVINLHDCTPDVVAIEPLMLMHAPKILMKLSPMLDITDVASMLGNVRNIYVVEQRNECRELLVEISRDYDGPYDIVLVRGLNQFRFSPADERDTTVCYGTPHVGDYLYELSPGAMKTGGFKYFAQFFGLTKIAPNSHLYFSDAIKDGFPGKMYKIIEVMPYASSVIKRLAKRVGGCEVAVRNFPLTATELRKKLKLKESDSLRLMATTDVNGQKMMLLLEHTRH